MCAPWTWPPHNAWSRNAPAASQLSEAEHSISSRYFEVLGRLRLGDTRVQERSLVRRTNMEVQTLWRERGQFDTVAANPTPP